MIYLSWSIEQLGIVLIIIFAVWGGMTLGLLSSLKTIVGSDRFHTKESRDRILKRAKYVDRAFIAGIFIVLFMAIGWQ